MNIEGKFCKTKKGTRGNVLAMMTYGMEVITSVKVTYNRINAISVVVLSQRSKTMADQVKDP